MPMISPRTATPIRACTLLYAFAAFALVGVSPAFACACCSHVGSRNVGVDTINDWRANQLEQMEFAGTARLSLGEADPEIKGITNPSSDYDLKVARQKGRMVFALRDKKGRAGNLYLAMPRTISIFEVDPRDEDKDSGLGPLLYKEWKLTANAAGDGLFAAAAKGKKITLVLHGRGRGCTEAADFTAWTLLLHAPKDVVTLIGTLDSGRK
jgi:hypothetical protein